MDFLFESIKDDQARMSSKLKWICRVLEVNFPNMPLFDDYERDTHSIADLASRIDYIAKYIEHAFPIEKLPKAKGKLRELQNSSMEILVAFDKFCKSINAKYWLDYGTLIGALRHKGFIPWDDDVDLCMMNDEWEKIKRNVSKMDKYGIRIVQAPFLEIPKIKWNEEQLSKGKNENAFVDIFSFYKLNPSITEEDAKKKAAQVIEQDLSFARKIPEDQLKRLFERCYQFNKSIEASGGSKATHIFRGLEYSIADPWDSVAIDCIFPLGTIDFEGHKLPIPNKPEERLEHFTYGPGWKTYPKRSMFLPHHIRTFRDMERAKSLDLESFSEWIARQK